MGSVVAAKEAIGRCAGTNQSCECQRTVTRSSLWDPLCLLVPIDRRGTAAPPRVFIFNRKTPLEMHQTALDGGNHGLRAIRDI
jgi:hypothetical protein